MTVLLDTLPNGFRIVTEHMPGLHSASIGIWIAAGGRHERPEQNGIAHFLEHMAFKGTKTRSALRIAEEIEDVGGYINAYTSREMTAYYARVLEADTGLALDVIADIVLNPVFDPKEIEIERHVILQEIGQALDTPDDIIFDWLQEASYPGQAFGRTILGPEERVSTFGRADLTRFVGEHYGPDHMILAAAGGVDHGRIVAQAQALFGHLKPVGQRPMQPADFLGGERRELKSLEQVHFAMAFEAPNYRAPTSMRRRSMPWRSGAACPRGSSRRCARSAASAIRSSPSRAPTRIPGRSRSMPAPRARRWPISRGLRWTS